MLCLRGLLIGLPNPSSLPSTGLEPSIIPVSSLPAPASLPIGPATHWLGPDGPVQVGQGFTSQFCANFGSRFLCQFDNVPSKSCRTRRILNQGLLEFSTPECPKAAVPGFQVRLAEVRLYSSSKEWWVYYYGLVTPVRLYSRLTESQNDILLI